MARKIKYLKEGIIYVGVIIYDNIVSLSTGVEVSKNNWNGEYVIREDEHYKEKNAVIDDYQREFDKFLEEGNLLEKAKTPKQLEKIWNSRVAKEMELYFPFINNLRTWLYENKNNFSSANYNNMLNAFNTAIEFKSNPLLWDADLVDDRIISDFIDYLIYDKGFSYKEVTITLNGLELLYKNAFPEIGDFRFMHFPKYPEMEYWFLNEDQVKKIADAKINNNELDKVRDLLLLSISSGASIIRLLTSERDSFWYERFIAIYSDTISDDFNTIPFKDYGLMVIKKYSGILPQMELETFKTLLRELLGKLGLYSTFNDLFMDSLHELGVRTYISNGFLYGMTVEELEKITGLNKSGVMRRYMLKAREEMNQHNIREIDF